MNEQNIFESIANIDEKYIEEARTTEAETTGAETTAVKKKQPVWIKWGAIAACLCLAVVGVIVIMPKPAIEKVTGIEGSGDKPERAGFNEGIVYSIAVLPADVNHDDIQSTYCEEINQEQAQSEVGLCDFLPSDLPDGYHFDVASMYITTMKDGTVYRMLKVTYRSGDPYRSGEAYGPGGAYSPGETYSPREAPVTPSSGEGEVIAQIPGNLGDEFRVSIVDFEPDTSRGIYAPEVIVDELNNGNLGNGMFYVRYENYYVGIDPLSLSPEEIVDLIESISW